MKKFYISLAAIFLSVLLFISVSLIIFANIEAKYTNTYYGELENKTERLDSIDGEKIVFIGGSSLSFGIKSKEMEEALGMPVSSYGLYASLGTKVMAELAYKAIQKGDIVILSPEIFEDTYSTNMNYKNILKCFEEKKLYQRLSLEDQINLLYNYPSFSIEKMNLEIPEEKKPYTKDSFDSYGEIYDDLRSQNIMYDYYDTSMMISPNKELFDEDFITYLNEYNQRIKNKGATLYFSYSPTNRLALDEKDIEGYEKVISERLEFDSLGSIEEFLYNEYYFYDTNFHLNSAGAYLHSKKLTEVIGEKLDIEIKKEIEVPSIPSPLYEKGDTITIDSITYTKTNEGYFVSGVEDEFSDTTINIPKTIFGLSVVGISDYAFSNLSTIEEIILPETIISLGNAIFSGDSNLTKVYLNSSSAPLVPASGLFDGANDDIKIYVPKAKLKLYTSGYTWMNYLSYLATY